MNRSREGAHQVLLSLRQQIIAGMTNERAKRLLSEELVAALLDAAWQHQFDESRTDFKNDVQMINFGPYHGEHNVALDTAKDAPVIVLHGENTWGKTSFINAIRWCLYGRVRGIDRRDKALWRLVNRDAFTSGDRIMAVKLNFTQSSSA
jgi:hypothetical protein